MRRSASVVYPPGGFPRGSPARGWRGAAYGAGVAARNVTFLSLRSCGRNRRSLLGRGQAMALTRLQLPQP